MPTWTTDPPAVRGEYWHRYRTKGRPGVAGVVLVRPLMGGEYQPPANDSPATLVAYMPGAVGGTPVTEMRGEWWGPLAPPGDGGAVVSDSDRGPATAAGEPWKGV